MSETIAQAVFHQLQERYLHRVPIAAKVYQLLEQQGDTIINDHVAFRAFGLPQLGIAALEIPFLQMGYLRKEEMYFADKHLKACWYLPPQLDLPKVFISELILEDISDASQSLIQSHLTTYTAAPFSTKKLNTDTLVQTLSVRPWKMPSYAVYQQLLEESEYAAWVLVFGFQVNHYTVLVNRLTQVKSLDTLNQFLLQNHIPMNDSGGITKGTRETGLAQSSTVASQIEVTFSDGIFTVPYAYLEFAERFPLPEFAHLPQEQLTFAHYFQGFLPENANHIFESTNRSQVLKS